MVLQKILSIFEEVGHVPKEQLQASKPFADYGLSSLEAIEVMDAIETSFKVKFAPADFWKYPTIEKLAEHVTELTDKKKK